MTTSTTPVETNRADRWTGLFWIVLGGAIIAYSSGMPIPRNLGATTLTGPGFVPMLLGGALALLGGSLTLRARRGGDAYAPDAPEGPISNGRAMVALVLMVAYAAALALRQPFIPGTILFVTLFVTVFNWADKSMQQRLKTACGALLLATITAIVIQFLFEQIFFVRLP